MVLCDESLFHLILLKGCGTHVNAHVELGLQVLANLLPRINYPGGVSRSLSHESLATLGITCSGGHSFSFVSPPFTIYIVMTSVQLQRNIQNTKYIIDRPVQSALSTVYSIHNI